MLCHQTQTPPHYSLASPRSGIVTVSIRANEVICLIYPCRPLKGSDLAINNMLSVSSNFLVPAPSACESLSLGTAPRSSFYLLD